jgi:hypothetical protein
MYAKVCLDCGEVYTEDECPYCQYDELSDYDLWEREMERRFDEEHDERVND